MADIALNPKGMKEVEIAIGEGIDLETADIVMDKTRLQSRLAEIEKESLNIFRILGDMADTAGLALVKDKIAALGAEKAVTMHRLGEVEERISRADDRKEAIERIETRVLEFKAGWRKGSLAQKKRLIRALIERIEVRPGALGLFYLVREDDMTDGNGAKVHRPAFKPQKEALDRPDLQNKKAVGNFVIPAASFDVDDKIGVTDGA